MKVMISDKKNNRKTFIEMQQISIQKDSEGEAYSLYAFDIANRKIVLKNLTENRAQDIEVKICQDFIIDLTPEFEAVSHSRTNPELTPEDMVAELTTQANSILR